MIRQRSLLAKIITWSFVPTAIILLAVALVTFYAYQRVTEDLVIGRNQQLVRLAAGQLAADMSEYAGLLSAVGRASDIYAGSPEEQRAALAAAQNRLLVFDGGVVVLNEHGTVTATEPQRPGMHGQDWSSRSYFREVLRVGAPVFSDVVADGPGSADVIAVAVPITGEQGEFRGTLVGMFRLGATSVSAFYGSIVKLRVVESGNSYLLDQSRQLIYHSDADRIGHTVSSFSHVGQLLAGATREVRTRDSEGREIVASFAPVPATSWVLVAEEGWDVLLASSLGYQQFLLLLLGLGIVIPALVVTFGVRRITGPIQELIAASQEVAEGKFGQTISVQTGDELEDLAEQFNSMSAQLRESYADLEQKVAARTKELATLNAISAVVSRSLDLDEILQSALEHTARAVGVESGGIYLLDEEELVLRVVAHRELGPDFVAGIDNMKVGDGFSGRVVQTGQPIVVRDVLSDPRLPPMVPKSFGPFSLATVPLSSKGKVLGTLFLAAPGGREFSEQDVQLLCSIGHQIGVAIENGLLYRRAQQLAVLEERNRLARDLHDSVTQAVFGVTLYAEAATRLLSAGQVETASEHLQELRTTAQQALREMRSLIYELRPPVLEKEGLVAALQARLEAVEGRAGVRTELRLEGDILLPRAVEEELYRVAQEALNNALKHSQAKSIRLLLRRDETHLLLEVADDGVGFEAVDDERHGGLGLPGMKERALKLGGSLEVLSRPGEGTTVRVEVPWG